MKNKYLELQVPALIAYLLVGVVAFIHALWFATPFKDTYRSSIGSNNNAFFEVIQTINNYLFAVAVVTIVLVGICFFLGNNYRKVFYISNKVSSIAVPSIVIVLNILAMVLFIPRIKANWDLINFTKLELLRGTVTDQFIGINYLVCVVGIIMSIAYLVVSILAIKNQNKIQEVAGE